MKKTARMRAEALAAAMELPMDAAAGAERVELVSGREALVENHRGIIDYSPEQVYVRVSSGTVKITGSSLRIAAMDRTRLRVSGRIDSVNYV